MELIAEPGYNLAVLGQGDGWQIGFTIVADTFGALRAAGAEPLRPLLRRRVPWLADRIDLLTDTNQLTLLPIRITRVEPWSEPGLLLDRRRRARHLPGRGQRHQLRHRRRGEAANRLVRPLDGSGRSTRRRSMRPRPRSNGCADRGSTASRPSKFGSNGRPPKQLAAHAEPRPALPLRLIAAVPGLARWSARRAAKPSRCPARPAHPGGRDPVAPNDYPDGVPGQPTCAPDCVLQRKP